MDEPVYAAPRCQFYERVPTVGGFHYDMISINGPGGYGRFVTPYPPAKGDLIILWDAHREHGGVFRVIERAWHHSSYGSTDWPYAERTSKQGPMLDIFVERADGPFVDEVARPEEEAAE